MTKPQEFDDQQIIRHDSPYQVDARFAKGPQAGTGVLSVGRVVWTESEARFAEDDAPVNAFAEGIGVVSVQAESLRS